MTEERLDRIERILEAVVLSNQTALSRLERIEAAHEASSHRLGQIESLVDSNARSIAANHQAITQLTTDIGGLALQIEQMSREAQQDRSQAALDRAEFRTTVQTILDTWTERFGRNGHAE